MLGRQAAASGRHGSSRLVTATLETGKGKSGQLHVLSFYAPTFAASREKKDKFFDLLQDALLAIPSGEYYLCHAW